MQTHMYVVLALIAVAAAAIVVFLLVVRRQSRKDAPVGGVLNKCLTIRHDWRPLLAAGMFRCVRRNDNSEMFRESFENLTKICVITTDKGPFIDDAFMVFFFPDMNAALPSQHPDWQTFFDDLAAMVPLDLQTFIDAGASMDNAVFTIWSRSQDDVRQ